MTLVRLSQPRDDLDQFRLAVALHARDPRHFARTHIERDIVERSRAQPHFSLEALHLQDDRFRLRQIPSPLLG